MSPSVPSSCDQVLDRIHETLRRDFADAEEKEGRLSSVIRIDAHSADAAKASFYVEVAGTVTLRALCSIARCGAEQFEVRVAIEEGTTRCFSVDVGDSQSTPQIGRTVSALLLNEADRRRESALRDVPPHVPLIELNRKGDIERMNGGARRALEYASNDTVDPCFFSHVHARNLWRVMRDVAYMVSQKMQRARWLVRLRTGTGRWRWYRGMVENHLYGPPTRIQVLLRPL